MPDRRLDETEPNVTPRCLTTIMIFALVLLTPGRALAQSGDTIEAVEARWVIVIADDTPLRCGDFERFYPVAGLEEGTPLRLDGQSDEWARVVYPETLAALVSDLDARPGGNDPSGRPLVVLERPSKLRAANISPNVGVAGSWRSVFKSALPVGTALVMVEEVMSASGDLDGYRVLPPRDPSVVPHQPHAYLRLEDVREASLTERAELNARFLGGPAPASVETLEEANTAATSPSDPVSEPDAAAVDPGPGSPSSGESSEATGARAPDVTDPQAEPSARSAEDPEPAPSQPVESQPAPVQLDPTQAPATQGEQGPDPRSDPSSASETAGDPQGQPAAAGSSDPAQGTSGGVAPVVIPVTPDDESGSGSGSETDPGTQVQADADAEVEEMAPEPPPAPLALDELEAEVARVSAQGRTALDNAIDELIHEYERTLATLEEPLLISIANDRLELLRIRRQTRDERRAVDAALAAADDRTRAIREQLNALERTRRYAVVGRLVPSALYTGERLPLMYRIESVGGPAAPRTLGYVRAREADDLRSKLGELVGVVGDVRLDRALNLMLIRPVRVDVLTTTTTSDVQPAAANGG
ncbi:MAG: hypothetical protein AAGI53_02465 [Planctomycetota bacterium]